MSRSVLALLSMAAAFAVAACAGSDRPKHTHPVEEWHPPAEMLDKYADKSGTLTRSALVAGLHRDFEAADTNHDGCLDENEARVVNEERWKEDESTASPLIDFKHTGCIDFEEFAATPLNLFDQFDKSGKGVLTRAQLHPGQNNSAPGDHAGGHGQQGSSS